MSAPNRRTLQTAKLLISAIGDLRSASKDAIAEHIASESSSCKDLEKYLNNALKKGIAFGVIKKLRGRYYLGDAMEGIREHKRRRRKGKSKSKKEGRRRRRRRRL